MDALRCPPGDYTRESPLRRGKTPRRLCRLLLQKPDILLLDEPDQPSGIAESVAWLEHHLQKYEGTIIAVTHDRIFSG